MSGNNDNPFYNSAQLTFDRFGNANSAYSFNGVDQFIKGPCTSFPLENRTVSFWFNADNYQDKCGILGYGGGNCGTSFLCNFNQPVNGFYNNFIAQAHCGYSNFNTPTNYPPVGGWHNWIIVSGNGSTQFYLDGMQFANFIGQFSGTEVYQKNFVFGAAIDPGGLSEFQDFNVSYFKGKLDDIVIYNRILSSSEITNLFSFFNSNNISLTPPPTILANHLVAYYPFNGDANDKSGHGNNPSYNNASITTDRFGQPNNAYSFNGNQVIKGACDNFPSGNRTISFWFNSNNTAEAGFPFGYGGGVCGQSFFFEFNPSDYTNSYTCQGHCLTNLCSTQNGYPPKSKWNNWIIVTGNDKTKYYLNGNLIDSFNNDFDGTIVNGKIFTIGGLITVDGTSEYPEYGNHYKGKLDDIAIYDTVFSDSDISQLYNYFNSYPNSNGNIATGYTNVEATVGENGEAIASVKLNLPKGTYLQPSLSIDFSSQVGNGLLGIGMVLSGSVQAITRIAPTLEQDGFTKGISFDKITDRYAFNGERMKATFSNSLTDDYLKNAGQGEFRTEQESFSKIIPHVSNNAINGWQVDSFTVYIKDGLIMEFGFTPDSKIEAPNTTDKVYAWLLNKVYDRNGNYYTITYTEDNSTGEYRVAQILYTGNTTKAIVPYNRISFMYKERPDITVKYFAGYSFRTSKLLSEIQIYDHEILYRKYKLNYKSSSTEASKLISINEYGTDGNTMLKPVSFEWKEQTQSLGFTKTGSGNWTGHSEGNTNNILGDFDGNGKTDMAGYQGGNNWEISLSTGAGFITSIWPHGHNLGNTNNLTGDFNGDGKSDLAGYNGSGCWWVSLSTGTDFNTYYWCGSFPGPLYAHKYAGDFNGDGLTDIAAYAGGGNWDIYISNGNGFISSTWNDGFPTGSGISSVADFNGDGKTDIISYNYGAQWRMALSSGSSFSSFWWTGHGGDGNNNIIGDFNGDGLADITRFESVGLWSMCLSMGGTNGFLIPGGWYANSAGTNNNITGDFNNDGMSDIAYYIGSGLWNVYLSNNIGFINGGNWSGHSGGTANNFVGDFDGDGASDLITYIGGNTWNIALSNATKSFLSNVINGNGQNFSFTYKPITDSNVYKKGSSGTYPDLDFVAPFYVVSSLETDDGIGGIHRMNFNYADGKLNLRGRGFRGFGKVIRTDSISNSVLTTWYNTDYKCVAARPVRAELRTVYGKLLNLNINTLGLIRSAYNTDTVCFSYYSKTEGYNYELNGNLTTSKVNTYSYDGYGNPLLISEMYNDSLSVNTQNTYTNNTTDWILGRLTSTTVTKSQPGKITIIKNSTFKYNTKGFLIQEILLPSDAKLKLQTDYTLDGFGNRTQTKISGPNIALRTYRDTYDADGRFVIQSRNPLGHITKTSYLLGLPANTTDADKRVTQIVRDAFGRIVKITYPDKTNKTTNYYDCSSGVGCPVNAKWFLQEQNSGGPVSKTYFDMFDRTIRTEAESFGTVNILKDILFNNDGTVKSESDNFFSSASALNKTTYGYDEIKRVISKATPGNRVTQIQYNGLTITEINPENQKTIKTNNPEGKLASVTDNLNNKVLYSYDVDLNLITITDPNGNKVTMTYDLRGNKISMSDPDMGIYNYEFNCLGLMTKQTNAKGEVSTYLYDLLNRMTQRTEPEGSTFWTYDTTNAKGQIASIRYANGNSQKYSYLANGKLSSLTSVRGTNTRATSFTYNAINGLPEQVNLPNGVSLKNNYTTKGYLQSVTGTGIKASTVTLWTANSYDAYNTLTSYTLGNGLAGTKTYDAVTHYLTAIKTGKGAILDSVQNLSYEYSTIGNLTKRKDLKFGLQESFLYDGLNRLTQSLVRAQTALKTKYDKLGNITFKSDVGSYKYGENGEGPHTLTSIDHSTVDSCVYAFNQVVTYTSYNYAAKVTNQNTEIAFQYGPGRERETMTVKKNNKLVMTKNYYGGLYEEVTDSVGNISYNYYVKASNEVVAMIYSPSINIKASSKISYLLYDHLGSVYAYTDEAGKTTERVSYNAWGQPRDPLTWVVFKVPKGLPSFQRGFTFHEMLDMDFLVCMNARVYNPVLGRFLTPDPYVQFPDNLQSMNRYAYVLNNPLSFTDPSGYFLGGLFKFLKKNVATIAAVTIAVVTQQYYALPAIVSGAAAGFGAAFTSTIVNGGSVDMAFKAGVQGGIWGGISAGVAYGIGSAFGTETLGDINKFDVPKAFLHGVTQGEISELQGGDFRSGFFGGLGGELSNNFFKGNILMTSIAGGTISSLSGGSFANGAITATFVATYNDAMHSNTTIKKWQNFFSAFWNYTIGGGDIILNDAEMANIYKTAIESKAFTNGGECYKDFIRYGVNFDNTEYSFSIGRASLYIDYSGNVVKFSDTYNWDPKPWGARIPINEIATRAIYYAPTYKYAPPPIGTIGALLSGTSYKILYNK